MKISLKTIVEITKNNMKKFDENDDNALQLIDTIKQHQMLIIKCIESNSENEVLEKIYSKCDKFELSLKELVDIVKRNKHWLDKAKTEKEVFKKDIISARRIIVKCILLQNSDNELLKNIVIDI